MYFNWITVKDFYTYNCESNQDFLNRIEEIPRNGYDTSSYLNIYGNIIKNKDMIESTNQYEELKEYYIQDKLIAFRPGTVENTFLLKYYYNLDLKLHINFNDKNNIDYYMKHNAGLYYKDNKDKKIVLDWWCENTIELFKKCIYCSCYLILNSDIPVISKLNLKGKYYNYGYLYKVILENSENKKILYVGSAVNTIKYGYEKDLKKLWKFPVSNFSMYYLKTPITTFGMDYPHNSMIETCDYLIEEIKNNYNDFDTAIFGCGAYGSPLINILSKIYNNKNLIYLGSDCYKMFGAYSKDMIWPNYNEYVNKEHTFEVLEELPRGKSLSFELDVFPKLLMQNIPIKVIEVDAPFIDIGTEDSLGDASLFIEKNYQYFF
jgi:hypothetical protein